MGHQHEFCHDLPDDHRKNRPRLPARHHDALSTTAPDSFGGITRQGLVLVVALTPTPVPVAVRSSAKPDEKKKEEAHVLQSQRAAVAVDPSGVCDGAPMAVPVWGIKSCSDYDTVVSSGRPDETPSCGASAGGRRCLIGANRMGAGVVSPRLFQVSGHASTIPEARKRQPRWATAIETPKWTHHGCQQPWRHLSSSGGAQKDGDLLHPPTCNF